MKVGTVQMLKESSASLLEMKHHNIENPTKSETVFFRLFAKKNSLQNDIVGCWHVATMVEQENKTWC